jgi:hypothetical protein
MGKEKKRKEKILDEIIKHYTLKLIEIVFIMVS